MKDFSLRILIVILLLLSISSVSAHGLHIQELVQGAGGIMDESIHLLFGHGYWMIFLLVGLGLSGIGITMLQRDFQQRRGSQRRYNHHQHDR